MNSLKVFDVLVVYSDETATSAVENQSDGIGLPFADNSGHTNYNDCYGYFLEACNKLQLTAAFTTSRDIIGAGLCRSYWLYQDKNWNKFSNDCFSTNIFDKFSPRSKKRKSIRSLLFSSETIRPFNNKYIYSLFFDKLKTYKKLSDYSIPTVNILNASKECIRQALQELKKLVVSHPHKNDFTKAVVIKDRFGSGGNNIFLINKNFEREIYQLMQSHKKIFFVLQPFTKFDKGYSYRNYSSAPTDIRIIYQNGEIIQTYIRMAKAPDFRCNEHQGATLIYTLRRDIPQKVLELANKIARELNQNKSLFALDFIISNSGSIYFLEGNTGPGVDWNPSSLKNEQMSKQLINLIVKELSTRVSDKIETANEPINLPEYPRYPNYLPGISTK